MKQKPKPGRNNIDNVQQLSPGVRSIVHERGGEGHAGSGHLQAGLPRCCTPRLPRTPHATLTLPAAPPGPRTPTHNPGPPLARQLAGKTGREEPRVPVLSFVVGR